MGTILFTDNLHIHSRGFKSLIDFISQEKIKVVRVEENENLKILYGNYSEHKVLLLKYYDILKQLSIEELYTKKVYGISLFLLARAEMLAYLMSQENWYTQDIASDDIFVFEKAYKENFEDLLLNLSAVMMWLEFWQEKLKSKNYKNIKLSILFSGSLIYQKTLMYLLQNTSIKVYVVEHFFTGHDYYLEEKYTHIANNSDIKFKNYYNKLRSEFTNSSEDEKVVWLRKAIKKFKSANNKNVVQPKQSSDIVFKSKEEKKILIIGQVVNDFSILETSLPNINSLAIYKNMIKLLLNSTNYNIIFKAHPWEKSKANLKRSLTKEILTDYLRDNFSFEEQERFIILEDFNITQLINESDYIVGICSQGLLEASFLGKKVHQIGNAFFGEKGFTYDHQSEVDFVDMIKQNKVVNSQMTLSEYSVFLEFLAIMFEKHLVNNQEKNKRKLSEKLSLQYTSTVKEKASVKKSFDNVEITTSNNPSLRKRFIEYLVKIFSSDKKFKKFRSNQLSFFEDSHYLIVQILGKIYNFEK